jgi:hypothetical protein
MECSDFDTSRKENVCSENVNNSRKALDVGSKAMEQLTRLLIGFIKVDEHHDAQAFGNFFVTLSSREFLIRYVNDRSQLSIKIACQ